MLNQELLNYIRESLKQGFSKSEIRDALLNAGWRLDDITGALTHLEASDNSEVSINKSFFSKRKFAVLAAVFAAFLFTGSLVFAGYYYYKTMPARTIKKMGDRVNEIKSFYYNINLNFSGSSGGMNSDMEIILEGAADALDENNIKSYANINFSSKTAYGESKEKNISLEIAYKNIGNSNYLKFEIPQNGNGEEIAAFIKSAKADGKWVKITPEDIKELGIDAQAFAAGQSDRLGTENLPAPSNSSEDASKIAQAKKQGKLKEIFQKYNIFDATEYVGSETIQGSVKTRHISFTADKEELKKFLTEAVVELGDNTASQYGMENYEKELEKNLDALQNVEGDIWIGKDDSFLHKMEAKISTKDESSEGSLNFTLEFSGFNNPVSVEAPKDAVPIIDVLKNVLEKK